MKIGLIDVDGHNFPNLPLMKLSAYHKAQGDAVEWYSPLLSGHMDKVYMSKVFPYCHCGAKMVEPQDKIRTERENFEINGYIRAIEEFNAFIGYNLIVIDKHKTESEDKE